MQNSGLSILSFSRNWKIRYTMSWQAQGKDILNPTTNAGEDGIVGRTTIGDGEGMWWFGVYDSLIYFSLFAVYFRIGMEGR